MGIGDGTRTGLVKLRSEGNQPEQGMNGWMDGGLYCQMSSMGEGKSSRWNGGWNCK